MGSRCRYEINDYRSVFRTKLNSYDGAFYENNQWLKAVRHLVRPENAFDVAIIAQYKVEI